MSVLRWVHIGAAFGLLSLGCSGELEEAGSEGATSPAGGSGAAAAGAGGDGSPAGGAGRDGAAGQTAGADASAPVLPDGLAVGGTGMRRLSAHELDNVLRDLLGDESRPARSRLPEDVRSPFDNDYRSQQVSRVLVSGLESLAGEVVARLLSDPPRLARVVGCQPEGTGEACMRQFVTRVARLAFRRPLQRDEVDGLVALGMTFATPSDGFEDGVEVVLRALLQSAELLYRIELAPGGQDAEGEPFVLSDHQIATRMSFLIWGSTPDAALLDAADAGELSSVEMRRVTARRMLEDPRARDQVDRFHAMWLGYETLPHAAALTAAMRRESQALVHRVAFDDGRAWTELFTSGESFLDATLASHYGLPAPADSAGAWVDLAGSGRQGILSQGAFLSAAANPLDTSPTKRGKLVLDRLLCTPVPPPPPDVEADEPPAAELGMCKVDQYAAHRSQQRCAGCHQAMDGIGFGLERYDRAGRYRETEEGRPECAISGQGELPDLGPFSGPAELSDLLVGADLLDQCLVAHLFEHAMGRPAEPAESALLARHEASYVDSGRRFDALVLALVQDESFAHGRAPHPSMEQP